MGNKQRDHNEGQADGAKATVFDELVQNFNPLTSAAYNEGFEHGASNKPERRDSGDDSKGDSGSSNSEGSSKSSGCLLSTACVRAVGLPDDCEELETLRSFRDGWLRSSPEGSRLIQEYYNLAPALIDAIDRREDAAAIYDAVFSDLVKPCVRLVQGQQYAEAVAHYRLTVGRLGATFLGA